MVAPILRKVSLTAHVSASLGWFGAVTAFLALAVAGLAQADLDVARAAYVAIDVVTWYVIVPFAAAALVSGLVESAVTPWGLFRHTWVVLKLGITVACSVLLLVHTRAVGEVAAAAARGTLLPTDLRGLRLQLVVDAIAASAALLIATALSILKPFGPARRLHERTWRRYVLLAALALLTLIALVHLAGGGHRH
jgi:hypothetical protein